MRRGTPARARHATGLRSAMDLRPATGLRTVTGFRPVTSLRTAMGFRPATGPVMSGTRPPHPANSGPLTAARTRRYQRQAIVFGPSR